MSKTNPGRYFEDFRLGEVLAHATPRTLTAGMSPSIPPSMARALPSLAPIALPRVAALAKALSIL